MTEEVTSLYSLKVDNVPSTINFLSAEDLARAIVSCHVKMFRIEKNIGTLYLQLKPSRTAIIYQTLLRWLNATKDVDIFTPNDSSPSEMRRLLSCDITIVKQSMGEHYDTVIENAIIVNIDKENHQVILRGYSSIK